MKAFFSLFATLLLMPTFIQAKLVHYDLTITKEKINLSGKKDVNFALLVNGGIPAPVLEFNEGDEAEIVVTNGLKDDEVSIHWHGILLPPLMDGVPYVNTPPIFPGKSFTFRFPIRQSGTYWYHSHTNVQEQKGVYGAFIIHPKKETIHADKDIAVVLSDWSDEDATHILKNLRKDGDYYQFKKYSIRSWWGATKAGRLGVFLGNEWVRMGGMDLSDVGYDAFLINGKRESQLIEAKPGEKIRLRLINAAASTYFYVSLGNQLLNVVSGDGVNVVPVQSREILIGMAETYDVLFEIPEGKNYELKITAQDGTGSASGFIGRGQKEFAPIRPLPDLYAAMDHMDHMNHKDSSMDHAGHTREDAKKQMDQSSHEMPAMDHSTHKTAPMDHSKHAMQHGEQHKGHLNDSMGHSHHQPKGHRDQPKKTMPQEGMKEKPVGVLTVDELKSLQPTEFHPSVPTHNVALALDGDMERYVWYINGKAIHEERTILIQEGDVVRFTFINKTMMHHPMHLHGHFFRVLNKNKDRSPLKHTVDVPPHQTRTIEFLADEPGEWMLHCHNLYHLKTGMARVVKYSSFEPSQEIAPFQKMDPHLHDHAYYKAELFAATQVGEAAVSVMKTSHQWDLNGESRRHGDEWEEEGDLFRRQWFGRFLNIGLGAEYYDEKGAGAASIGYTLPLLIELGVVGNHRGGFRLDVEKDFQWTKLFKSDVELRFREDEKAEWTATLMYAPGWHFAAGAVFTEYGPGAGLEIRF